MATDSHSYPLNVGSLQLYADEVGTYPVRALLVDGYVYDNAHQYADDVTADELSGGSYARVDLTSVDWDSDGDTGEFTADDVTFASMTAASFDGVVVFSDRGADSASPLIGYVSFAPSSATAETVTVAWAGGVIVSVTVGESATDAADVTFTQGDAGDWTTDPDNVGEALDELAARSSGGGGGTVDVVSNVASGVILGRTTAGSGNSEELAPSAVRALLDLEVGTDVQAYDAQLAQVAGFTNGAVEAVTASAGLWIGTKAAYDALGSWSSTVVYVTT